MTADTRISERQIGHMGRRCFDTRPPASYIYRMNEQLFVVMNYVTSSIPLHALCYYAEKSTSLIIYSSSLGGGFNGVVL